MSFESIGGISEEERGKIKQGFDSGVLREKVARLSGKLFEEVTYDEVARYCEQNPDALLFTQEIKMDEQPSAAPEPIKMPQAESEKPKRRKVA